MSIHIARRARLNIAHCHMLTVGYQLEKNNPELYMYINRKLSFLSMLVDGIEYEAAPDCPHYEKAIEVYESIERNIDELVDDILHFQHRNVNKPKTIERIKAITRNPFIYGVITLVATFTNIF